MKPLDPQFQAGLMVSWSFVLLFVGLSCTQAVTSLPGSNETDQLALLAFKAQITDDPFKLFSSWNHSIHFCQWRGITCGRRHQRVVMLDLQSQKLTGSISPYIGNLSFLRVLHLQNNSFSHVIPPKLGGLKRLEILHLHNNSIGGEIPANLSGCSNLIDFRVAYNKLEGQLPVDFGSLSKLQNIHITSNELSGGIPSNYANLSLLQKFSAAINNFQGNIPPAFGRLTNLKIIALAVNKLSGTIPASIFNLSTITVFDVGINLLINGSLPSDIGNSLPNVEFLNIAINQFTGSIPVSISNASNLFYLGIRDNELTGGVPTLDKLHKLERLSIGFNYLGSGDSDDLGFLSSLTNATSLTLINLGINNFGGKLAETIGNLSTKLRKIYFDDNQISGSIPLGITNLINLERIWLFGNQFAGNVPFDIGKLHKLLELDFSKNELSGNIPSSLGNLSLLTELDLSENNLHGSIPPSLGNCKNLLSLNLAWNNLSGPIPQLVIGLSSLSYLDLSQNCLTGSLPVEVGNLKNLGYLNVSENMLSGEIPAILGSCVRLETLCMEGNLLKGTMPFSLTSLRGIQYLDLSRNNLSGRIPEYIETFKFLQILNLSDNDFEGAVPSKGIFGNASAISVVGNSKLCGGVPELRLPACYSELSKKRRLTVTSKLAISICTGLVGLTFFLFIMYICWYRKIEEDHSSGSPKNSFLKVSYQTLLEATDGFSPANLIGVGGFGSVYKGMLEHDGTIVAVKVLNLLHRGASKSFISECEALRNIRHRNLVKVLTACSGVDYQGDDFKALVYEFMVNGSLEEWLHPNPREDPLSKKPRKLNILQRLTIAIDVACALDYLHHHCQTPVVHCDLKPSNVLLDDKMIGHVGDFGLATFLVGANDSFSANRMSSFGIRGSVGYAAPEYGMGSEVSTVGDVYSYGILVLEMFTGKRPTDEMFNDGLNLRTYAKIALHGRLTEIVDPTLVEQGEDSETSPGNNDTSYQSNVRSHKIQDCLISIFGLGIGCSEDLPSARLDIGDVAAELHAIRDKLLQSGGI